MCDLADGPSSLTRKEGRWFHRASYGVALGQRFSGEGGDHILIRCAGKAPNTTSWSQMTESQSYKCYIYKCYMVRVERKDRAFI